MSSTTRGFRLSSDTWAVLLSLAFALLIKLGVLKTIGW
jgi:hypothetical protein